MADFGAALPWGKTARDRKISRLIATIADFYPEVPRGPLTRGLRHAIEAALEEKDEVPARGLLVVKLRRVSSYPGDAIFFKIGIWPRHDFRNVLEVISERAPVKRTHQTWTFSKVIGETIEITKQEE